MNQDAAWRAGRARVTALRLAGLVIGLTVSASAAERVVLGEEFTALW